MAKEEKAGNGYVKKKTALVVALMALVLGFLGGSLYNPTKPRERVPVETSVPPQQAFQDQGPSAEQTIRSQALEKETSANPENVEAWIQLGNVYFGTKQYQEAIGAYEKSLELNPNNADVWTDMGVMYRRNGQPKKAIEAFDKATEIDPQHEISRFNKGIVLMHDLNDPEGALQAWEELVKVNPSAKSPSGQPVMELIERFKESIKLRP